MQHKFFGVLANRRVVRYGLLSLNIVLLLGIGGFVLRGTQKGQAVAQNSVTSTAGSESAAAPLDQVSSADIAANASVAAGLPETTAVINQADSAQATQAVAPADAIVVAKPQSVNTALKSRKDIQTYVVQQGDTVASIAAKFNVTSDSIRWSNNLNGNTVNPGAKLLIPPVNGIVYTVQAGDTLDSLASKYRANKDQLVAFNDAEISGIHSGEQIIIPNGQNPAPAATASFFQAVAIYSSGSGYNGYDAGFCTWYVADRRIKAGSPLPTNLGNASTWDSRAAAEGLSVGRKPAVGAAVVTSHAGAGHVAYVEQVEDDGSIWVTEMNSYGQVSMTNATPTGGFGTVDWKHIPAGTASTLNYIY